jgi:DNA-binding CsgD family transcriptional regulator
MDTHSPAGRVVEVDRIEGWLDQARSGRSVVGALVGAAGIGKSTLLAAARESARGRGFTVLATRGRAADAEIGFASLLTLLRPVEADLDGLAGGSAEEVRSALALQRRNTGTDAVEVRLGVFRILTTLAERAPLLLVVDDAEHVDMATASALSFALGRLDADPVCALLASRSSVSGQLPTLATESLVVGPLDSVTLGAVVRERVDLDAAVLERVLHLADGNPLAALELAGSLTPDERWARTPLPPIPRPTAAMLHGFEARLTDLSEEARRVLAVVAADDLGEINVILRALAGLGEPDAGLAEAEAVGLLTRDATHVRLAHPTLRAVAYHRIAPASRRAAHRALAAALDQPDQATARAWQLAAAADGPDETAAAALELVARDAMRRGGPSSAARTLERAAALTPDPVAVQRRLVVAASLWRQTDPGRARNIVTRITVPADADIAAMILEAGGTIDEVGVQDDRITALRAEQALDRCARGDAARAARASVTSHDAAASQLATAVLVALGLVERVVVGDGPEAEGWFAEHAWRQARAVDVAVGWADEPCAALDDPTSVVALARIDLLQGRARAALDRVRPRVELFEDEPARLVMAGAELLLGRRDGAAADLPVIVDRLEHEGQMRLAAEGWWLLARATGDGDARHRAASLCPELFGADAVADLVASGRHDQARALAVELEAFTAGGPLIRARARRAAATAGLDSGGFDAALAVCEEHGLAVEAMEVQAARGAHADTLARARRTDVRWFDVPRAPDAARHDVRSKLSAAELRVADAIAAGLTNRQAAEALFLSIKTVDFHLQQIYRKLGINTRTQLAVLASRTSEPAQGVVS